MRVLEILLLFLLASLLFRPLLPNCLHKLVPQWLLALTLVVFALHGWIERVRWQMVPAYVVLSGLVFTWLLQRVSVVRLVRNLGRITGSLALVIATALSIIFPVTNLPTPRGAYLVGTTSITLRDEARDEIFTDDPTDKRELMIQIWYPATPPLSARPAPWMQRMDIVGPAIAQWIRLPSFLLDHTGLVRSNSYIDVPVSEAEAIYPVLIASHGWGGFRNISANQNEALASHGYIVVSIDHPYAGLVTLFNDGRIILNKRSLLPERGETNFLSSAQTLVQVFSQDQRFVMDQLTKINTNDVRFAGRMDLARIGLFGHSTGGGAVVNTCAIDQRCKAGFGLDPWVEPVTDDIIQHGLSQPFMFMRSEEWTGPSTKNDPRLMQLFEHMRGPHRRVSVRGSRHYDFTLIGLLSPLAPTLKLKGLINGPHMLRLTEDYLVAFFDETLKGKLPDSGAQALKIEYPEAKEK